MAFRYFENPTYGGTSSNRRPRLLLVESQQLFADALTRLLRQYFYVATSTPGQALPAHDVIVIDADATPSDRITNIMSSNRANAAICLFSLAPARRAGDGDHVHRLSKAMTSADFLSSITSIARKTERARQLRVLRCAPQFPQIDVSSTFLFATPGVTVGGDWYDVMPSHGRMAFVIGDVAGHGHGAAITTNLLRRTIAKLLMRNVDPATILNRTNAVTLKSKALQATAICGYVDPRSGEIIYACAGHPPPILASGGEVRFANYGGLMLGVDANARYTTIRMAAPKRGMFVLYTDGVTETRGSVDGEQRLLSVVRDAVSEASDAARAIQNRIFNQTPPVDDASIVAVSFGYSEGAGKLPEDRDEHTVTALRAV